MKINQKLSGFTLVELVTTILLISILAVTVLPRLLTTSSYSAFTLRDEFISELRKAQLLALNNQDRCYRVTVTSTHYQLIRFNNTCTGSAVRTDSVQALHQSSSIQLVSTGSSDFNIEFNALGVPLVSGLPFSGGNSLAVIADEVLHIAIESEGYIHGI